MDDELIGTAWITVEDLAEAGLDTEAIDPFELIATSQAERRRLLDELAAP